MKPYIIYVFLLLSTFNFVYAQQQFDTSTKVQGKIFSDKNIPLGQITLELQNINDSSLHFYEISDNDGLYNFRAIPPGEYTLVTLADSYAETKQNITVVFQQINNVPSIKLKEHIENLNEVSIVTKKKPIIQVMPDKTLFNVESSNTSSGLTGLELLRKSPGVMVDNNNNIILKGVSGVSIFVDGKPTYLSGNALVQFLNSLRAENIETIELINSPSSKYEAEGIGGIINIIFKKGKSPNGILGSIIANGGAYTYTGEFFHNYLGSLNYKQNNTTIRTTYGIAQNKDYLIISDDRTQNNKFFVERNKMSSKSLENVFTFNIEQQLAVNHSLDFRIRVTLPYQDKTSVVQSTIYDIKPGEGNIFDKILNNIAPKSEDQIQMVPNLSYSYKNKRLGEFNFTTDYSFYNSKYDYHLNDIYYGDMNKTQQLSSNPYEQLIQEKFRIFAFKTDWTKSFVNDIKLEAGLKYSNGSMNNTLIQNDLSTGTPQLNLNYSNGFQYLEYIYAAYVQSQIPILKDRLILNLGVRNEYTNTIGILKDIQTGADNLASRNERKYNNLFPNAGIVYTPHPLHSISFQYGRRILRPSYTELNPFELKSSALSYQVGNPNLLPQLADKIDWSYTAFQMATLSVSYTKVRNVIYDFVESVGNAFVFTNKNLGSAGIWNVNVSSPFNLFKVNNESVISGFINLNYSYTTNSGSYQNKDYTFSFPQFNSYVEVSFKMTKTMSFQVSSWASSAGVWGATVQHDALGALDIALQKSFWNKKIDTKIYWRDILQTAYVKFKNDVVGAKLDNGVGRFAYASAGLNLSYKFGNSNIKKTSSQKSQNEEEERLNNKGGLGSGGDSK